MAQIGSRVEQSRAERSEKQCRPRSIAPAGQSTQMIVGATATPDAAILATAAQLYDDSGCGGFTIPPIARFLDADGRLPGQLSAVDSRASAVSGRLADAVLWLRRR